MSVLGGATARAARSRASACGGLPLGGIEARTFVFRKHEPNFYG